MTRAFIFNLLIDGEPARSKHAAKLAIAEDPEQVMLEEPFCMTQPGCVNEVVQEGAEIDFVVNGKMGTIRRKHGRLVVQ